MEEGDFLGSYRKPLKRSILVALTLFLLALCLVMTIGQYFHFRSTLYLQKEDYIRNVLTYTASGIDVDDLEQCIQTGGRSRRNTGSSKFSSIRFGIMLRCTFCMSCHYSAQHRAGG